MSFSVVRPDPSVIPRLVAIIACPSKRFQSSSSSPSSPSSSSSSSPPSSSSFSRQPPQAKQPRWTPPKAKDPSSTSPSARPDHRGRPATRGPFPYHASSSSSPSPITPEPDIPWRPIPSPRASEPPITLTTSQPPRSTAAPRPNLSAPSPRPLTPSPVPTLPPLEYSREETLRFAAEYKDTSRLLKANASFERIERAVYKHKNRARENQAAVSKKTVNLKGKDEGFSRLQGVMGVPIISTKPFPIEYDAEREAPCVLPRRLWIHRRKEANAERRKRVREGGSPHANPLFGIEFPLQIKFRTSAGINGQTAKAYLDPSTLSQRLSSIPPLFRPSFSTPPTNSNSQGGPQPPILFSLQASPPPPSLLNSSTPEARLLRPFPADDQATAGYVSTLRHETSSAYIDQLKALLREHKAEPELVERVMEMTRWKREKLGEVPPMPKKEVDRDGSGSGRREEVTIGVITKVGKKNTHVLATARNKSKRKARTALGMAICLEHQRVLGGGMPRFEWRGWQYSIDCPGYLRWTRMETIVEKMTELLTRLAPASGWRASSERSPNNYNNQSRRRY